MTFSDTISLLPGCEEYGASCVTCTSATCTQCADGTYFDAGTDECESEFYKCI